MIMTGYTRRWWRNMNGTWKEQCHTSLCGTSGSSRRLDEQAVGLQDGRVTGNKNEVLEEVAKSFRRQHNQGQQGLRGTMRQMVQGFPRVFTAEQSEAIHRSRVTLGEMKEAVRALKRKKSPGVDQLVGEAYQNLEAPELDGLAGRVTEVLRTGKPRAECGGKVRPLYKKGDHLRPENWRPICCAVTEAKLVWMVIFGKIERRLYEAGVITNNMLGFGLGRVHTGSRLPVRHVPR